MKKLLMVGALWALGAWPSVSYACVVVSVPFTETIVLNDVIAIGSITSIDDQTLTFQIEEYLKGSLTDPTLIAYRNGSGLSLVKPAKINPKQIPIAADTSCRPLSQAAPELSIGQRFLIRSYDQQKHIIVNQGPSNLAPSFSPRASDQTLGLVEISDDTITIQSEHLKPQTITLDEARSIIQRITGQPPRHPIHPNTNPIKTESLLPFIIEGIVISLCGIGLYGWRRRQQA